MTLLTIVQHACDRMGFTRPQTVVSNTDATIKSMLAILNDIGRELVLDYPWQSLRKSVTHTTIAAELQGTVSAIMPGYSYILADAVWDRSNSRRVYVVSSASDWQRLKAQVGAGVIPNLRIYGDSVYMFPVPTAGDTIGIEYITENWVHPSSGSDKSSFTADDDTSYISEILLRQYLIFKFKAERGLEYGLSEREAEKLKMDLQNKDNTPTTVNTSSRRRSVYGISIPNEAIVV